MCLFSLVHIIFIIEMENAKLIVTLIPADGTRLAERAFSLVHNRNRYLAPDEWDPEEPAISTRESTPAPVDQPTEPSGSTADHHDYSFTHRIQLHLDKGPKYLTEGFTFGTSQHCDVLLGSMTIGQTISGKHFCITFDEESRLVLKDFSRYGTAVSYNGQGKNEWRHHFSWILDLKKQDGSLWDVQVHFQNGLEFKVQFATHETCKTEYKENLNRFMTTCRAALPALGKLGLKSNLSTAEDSQAVTPRRYPLYIRERQLGKGAFGVVDMVINVSTGATNARKTFLEPYCHGSPRQKREQKEQWLRSILKEIHIMKNHPHDHIVSIVYSRDDAPFFVMDYFKLGSLEDLWEVRRKPPGALVTMEETRAISFQTLQALAYLHSRGVTHRDLKPANILVASEKPFSIRLADFGLSSDKTSLKTFCGSPLYCAPEVYPDATDTLSAKDVAAQYTPSVDIWSLGVIILACAYGLPPVDNTSPRSSKAFSRSWSERLVKYANECDSHSLSGLTILMLCIDPMERLSADACLEEGYDLGIFCDSELNPGSVTPTQTVLNGRIRPDDTSATIVLSPLWNYATPEFFGPNRDAEVTMTKDNSEAYIKHQTVNPRCLLAPLSNGFSLNQKRQRSPVNSPSYVKRSRCGTSDAEAAGSRCYVVGGQPSDCSVNCFPSMNEAVVALLADLSLVNECNTAEDKSTINLVERISETLARLHVTQIHYYDRTDSGTVTLESNTGETILTRLISRERMRSTTELAAYLLHMLQTHDSFAEVRGELPSEACRTLKQPNYHTYKQTEGPDVEPDGLTIRAPFHASSLPRSPPTNGPVDQSRRHENHITNPSLKECYEFEKEYYWPWSVNNEVVYICFLLKCINVTQLLKAAGKPIRDISRWLRSRQITRRTTVQGRIPVQGTYINLDDGSKLYSYLGLPDPPDFVMHFQTGHSSHAAERLVRVPEKWIYQPVPIDEKPVCFCPAQELINANQFCASQKIPKWRLRQALNITGTTWTEFHGYPVDIRGIYVSYKDMVNICSFLRLREDILHSALHRLSAICPQKTMGEINYQREGADVSLPQHSPSSITHVTESPQNSQSLLMSGSSSCKGLIDSGDDETLNNQEQLGSPLSVSSEAVQNRLSSFGDRLCENSLVTYPSDLSLSYFV